MRREAREFYELEIIKAVPQNTEKEKTLMKTNFRKAFAFLLMACMLFGMLPAVTFAANTIITITEETTVDSIKTDIWGALMAASPGDIVTVTGSKTNEDGWIVLYIPTGVTLVWRAESKGLELFINQEYHSGYHGTFELAEGGKIEGTGNSTLYMPYGDIVVSGGEISAIGGIPAIYAGRSNVTVSGGVVSSDGDGGDSSFAIYLMEPGTVKVTGGHVSAGNATNNYAIMLAEDGLAAFLAGTCEGSVYCGGNGAIVEVDSLRIPNSFIGTNTGLTRRDGTAHPNPTWGRSGDIARIVSGSYSIEWGGTFTQSLKNRR